MIDIYRLHHGIAIFIVVTSIMDLSSSCPNSVSSVNVDLQCLLSSATKVPGPMVDGSQSPSLFILTAEGKCDEDCRRVALSVWPRRESKPKHTVIYIQASLDRLVASGYPRTVKIWQEVQPF